MGKSFRYNKASMKLGTEPAGTDYSNTAFTLAEVLITLGIIGIVAALTIPNLMGEYRKRVTETRLAKFYSVMNQAIERAEADYGDKTEWETWDYSYVTDEDGNKTKIANTEYFDKYFRPYIKALRIELNEAMACHIVYFADGSVASMSYKSIQFWPIGKNFHGYDKDEDGNTINDAKASGIKYFTFHFSPNCIDTKNKYHCRKGIEPYKWSWDGTREMLLEDNSIGCKETVSNERAYCAALIQMNGWKIPDDYPLKF